LDGLLIFHGVALLGLRGGLHGGTRLIDGLLVRIHSGFVVGTRVRRTT
jgi:hypothetical protein